MQGQNEASLYSYKQTLLYLCASYNYATGWTPNFSKPPVKEGDAKERDPAKSLGLYTLGRIFEQSITELEILEAELASRGIGPDAIAAETHRSAGVLLAVGVLLWLVNRLFMGKGVSD